LEICAENDITVYTSSLPDNVDPDEYLLANGRENFYKLLDKNLKSSIKFMIDRVSSKYGTNTLEAKTKIVSELLDFVSKNKNAIIQRDYIKQISQTLNLEEEVVWQEFKRKVLFKAENVSQNIQKQERNEKINLEEQLLEILLEKRNRDLIKKLTRDFFTNANCVTVYNMLLNNSEISVPEIMSKLDDKTAKWFSSIAIDNKEESKVSEEKFKILCKDIEIKRLRAKRKTLEKEVLLMTEGKKEMDLQKIKEYQELTKEIKGSGKK
jgi:DNA primase